MSTQTQPAAPDADEPTIVVDDDRATALAALAWSEADDNETIPFDHDRSTTFWLRLYAGTTAAFVLALGIVLWFVLSSHHQSAQEPAAVPASSAPDVIVPSSPTAAAPEPTPSAAPVPMPSAAPAPMPPPVAAAPSPEPTWGAPTSAPLQGDPQARDAAFVRAMRAHGITFTSQAGAIEAARAVCTDLGQDYPQPNVVAAIQNHNPRLTNAAAYEFLGLSTTFYCPEYNGG
jgi:hypothetical protein